MQSHQQIVPSIEAKLTLDIKEKQKMLDQKKLIFSSEHMESRFKQISNEYMTQPLEQQFPHQRPSLAPEQQQRYRQNLSSNEDYHQFQAQTLNLFRQLNYTSSSTLHNFGDVFSLFSQLSATEQTQMSLNQLYQRQFYDFVWNATPKNITTTSITIIDLIKTLYLEIDLQIHCLFTIICEDIPLDTEKQHQSALYHSMKKAFDTLDVLTGVFYKKGVKSQMDCLYYIRRELLIRQIQFPQIDEHLQTLQTAILIKDLTKNLEQGKQTISRVMEIIPVMQFKRTFPQSNDNKQIITKNRILHHSVSHIFNLCLKRHQSHIPINEFASQTIQYKRQLRQTIQTQLILQSHNTESINNEQIFSIIHLMTRYMILAQSLCFGRKDDFQMFTVYNKEKELQFLSEYFNSKNARFIHSLIFGNKETIFQQRKQQFCEIWLSDLRFEPSIQCTVCYRNLAKSSFFTVFNCQHHYCLQCLKQYFAQKIKFFQSPICPNDQCLNQTVNKKSKFFQYLSKNIKEKLIKIQRFQMVSKDPLLKLCPKEECQGIIKTDKILNQKTEKTSIQCPKCSNIFCSKCMMKFHEDQCDLNELNFFQNNLRYRQCSNCKAIVQKIEGCPHMTCLCKNEFCYDCGEKWSNEHKRQCERMAQGERNRQNLAIRQVQMQEHALFQQVMFNMRNLRERQRERQGVQLDNLRFNFQDRYLNIANGNQQMQIRNPQNGREREWLHDQMPIKPVLRNMSRQMRNPRQPERYVLPQRHLRPTFNPNQSINFLQTIQSVPQRLQPSKKSCYQFLFKQSSDFLMFFALLKTIKMIRHIHDKTQRMSLLQRCLIWTLTGLITLFFLPIMLLQLALIDTICVITGGFVWIFAQKPKSIETALMIVSFPLTFILVVWLSFTGQSAQFRKQFNQVFPCFKPKPSQ